MEKSRSSVDHELVRGEESCSSSKLLYNMSNTILWPELDSDPFRKVCTNLRAGQLAEFEIWARSSWPD
jgi:hypothetical protein